MTELVCLLELPSGSVGKGNPLRWWLLSWVGGRETWWDGAVCAHVCVRHLPSSEQWYQRCPWAVSQTPSLALFFIDLPSLSCPFSMHGGGFHLSGVTFLCSILFIVTAD